MWLDHHQNSSDGGDSTCRQTKHHSTTDYMPSEHQHTQPSSKGLPQVFLTPPIRANHRSFSTGGVQFFCAYCVHEAPHENAGQSKHIYTKSKELV